MERIVMVTWHIWHHVATLERFCWAGFIVHHCGVHMDHELLSKNCMRWWLWYWCSLNILTRKTHASLENSLWQRTCVPFLASPFAAKWHFHGYTIRSHKAPLKDKGSKRMLCQKELTGFLFTSGQSRCFHGMRPQMKSRWSSRNVKIRSFAKGLGAVWWCVVSYCSAWKVQANIKAINAGQRLPAGWTFDLLFFLAGEDFDGRSCCWHHDMIASWELRYPVPAGTI